MVTLFRTPLDHIGLLLPVAAGSMTNATLSSNNSRLAWVFMAETTSAITQVGFRLATITDGGSMPTYRLSLQGVDGSGLPDGTIKGAGNSAFVTFVPTTGNGFANSTFTWQTLGTSYTPSAGEALALVLDVSSGTAGAGNNIAVTMYLPSTVGDFLAMPYALQDTNLTWATADKRNVVGCPVFGYQTTSDVFGYPLESAATSGFSSTTEVALRFTLPTGLGSAFQLLGAVWCGNSADTGRLLRLSLYSGGESSPSLLEQVETDSDWVSGLSGFHYQTILFDDAPVSLAQGTQYHLGLAVNGGTTPNVYYYQFHAAGDMKCLPYGDSAFCLASRTITYPPGGGGNAFASSSTQLKQRPILLPLLSAWTVPSGGGLLIHPGMGGGMRA